MSSSSNPDRAQQRQLGELMTELGMITSEQLAAALDAQRESGRALGQIIVELGFASGAAVAHALAIQSGGALRTEYGYALGLPGSGAPGEETRADSTDAGHSKIPTLRLVESASPAVRGVERSPTRPPAAEEPATRGGTLGALTEAQEALSQTRKRLAECEAAAVERDRAVAEVERLRGLLRELPERHAEETAAVVEERNRTAANLGETQEALGRALEQLAAADATAFERDGAFAEIERLQGLLADGKQSTADEVKAVSEERDRLAAGLGETQEALGRALEQLAAADEAASEREGMLGEIERLRGRLAEVEEVAEQRAWAVAEVERMQTVLAEMQAQAVAAAEEREWLAGELAGSRQVLAETQQRLAAADAAAAERDGILAEIEGLRAQAAAGAEERDRLAGELADAQQIVANAGERLAVTEAEAGDRARAVALLEEERGRLAERLDEAQADLGEMRERLGAAEEAAATCDGALAEVERLHALLGRTHGAHAAEIAASEEERERLVADVQASTEALNAALERVTAAEAEASERGRAATEVEAERDRLAQELDDVERALRKARKRLAAANRVTEARDRARAEVERLRAVVDAWQAWAGQAPVVGQAPREPSPAGPIVDGETDEHVLLVPTRSGYAFVQGTGPSPCAGETIELVDPETGERTRFTVTRVGRSPLPNGGTCVYLLEA